MKRLFCAVPVICVISACASPLGTAVPTPELDIPFSAEADISYGGEECAAQIRRLESGRWEFCLTEPYSVEGLIITLSSGETKLKMYDMESAGDVSSDAVSMAKAIAEAYDAAAKDGEVTAGDSDTVSVTGNTELGGCTVCLGSDLIPLSLTADIGKLSVDITKFAPLERGNNDDADVMLVQ